ncbi:MAG TPA: sigma factor, partial [Vicinamibacterales bacterium]|nr:sigma factor [Vicinamibacterales bacterium]
MRDPRDEGLIERLRTGDQLAVAELASIYGPRIYQLAFRYVKNREDAEEVAQDVLLKVVTKIHAFRGDAALSSWIYRIT